MSDTKGLLWMYLMPRLTENLFREAAFSSGVCKVLDLNGTRVELWPKLNEMTGAQWSKLRARCAELTGNAASSIGGGE